MSNLDLKVGKKYLTIEGGVVEIVRQYQMVEDVFVDSNGTCRLGNGVLVYTRSDNYSDLVGEYEKPTTTIDTFALEAMLHSARQGMIPGNDKTRELKLLESMLSNILGK